MARITKHPAVRREELLDVAFALSREQGFEATSVEQVTQAAGVAKGTFYHYFGSKAELQHQLVGRFGDALLDHLTAADASYRAEHAETGKQEPTGAQRLGRLMAAAGDFKTRQASLWYATFLYREENFVLRHRLFETWRHRTRTVLLPLITDGIADGSLDFPDAESATDLVLLLWYDAADHLWERAITCTDAAGFAQVMLTGAAAITAALERLLGVPPGTYAAKLPDGVHTNLATLYSTLGSDL